MELQARVTLTLNADQSYVECDVLYKWAVQDPGRTHLHMAVYLLPRGAGAHSLLQWFCGELYRILDPLEHLPLVGICCLT